MPDENKKKAAQARWNDVSAESRKAIMSKASHARWKKDGVELALHKGVVKIGDFELSCAVLANGRRVISERSFCDSIQHRRHPEDYREKAAQTSSGILPLPAFVSPAVRQFLSPEALEKLQKPIRYRTIDGFGIPAIGMDATVVADLCEAYLGARDAGFLDSKDMPKATAAYHLMRAFARVALVALIDEATGYQVERDKDELQRLLDKYVAEEYRRYTPMFPTEFYAQIFRLRNVNTEDFRKRPAYFGRLTNDVVYQRMLPGMLDRLRLVNPKNEDGTRPRKHHQHLSTEQGVQHLREHLLSVVALMRASRTWSEFESLIDRALPKQVVEEPLALVEAKAEG